MGCFLSSLRDTTHTARWGTRRPRQPRARVQKALGSPPRGLCHPRSVTHMLQRASDAGCRQRHQLTPPPQRTPPHTPVTLARKNGLRRQKTFCLTLHPLVCLANGAVVQRGPQSLCFSEQNGASPASSHHPALLLGAGADPRGRGWPFSAFRLVSPPSPRPSVPQGPGTPPCTRGGG